MPVGQWFVGEQETWVKYTARKNKFYLGNGKMTWTNVRKD